MAEKINHWCIICGKGYHACDACDEVKTFTPWRRLVDSPEHYQVYLIVRDYGAKLISKAEAKNMLNNTDISDMSSFKDGVRNILTEILREDPVSKRVNKRALPLDTDIEVNTESVSDDTDKQ